MAIQTTSAIEYHLDVDGIKGESGATKHKEHIEIMSWSWGATNPTTIVGMGMSAGKVSVSDLSFTKRVDKSSPKLLELCVTGKHVKQATLYCSKQTGGKTPEDFLTIKLQEVYVSSYQVGGSHHEDVGTESLSLSYGVIDYDYKEQKPDGTLIDSGEVVYDVRKREQVK
jgi:type VI secretion system secreted protein Hcp